MNFLKNLFGGASIEPLDVTCKIECTCKCEGNSFDASAETAKGAPLQNDGHLNGKKVSWLWAINKFDFIKLQIQKGWLHINIPLISLKELYLS